MPYQVISSVLTQDRDALVRAWQGSQAFEGLTRRDLFSDEQGRVQCHAIATALAHAAAGDALKRRFDVDDAIWDELKVALRDVAQQRIRRGVSPADVAGLILALKYPLFTRVAEALAEARAELLEAVSNLTRMIDAFALYTMQLSLVERDKVIERQRAEMLELSTPVVEIWDRILAVPLIGTVDSNRANEVMENVLGAIADKQAEVVIIDITGVVTIDTQVAQHLLRTASAVRLMGAEAIVSGISPRIAQTMVQLGVDTLGLRTRSTLRAALVDAFDRVGSRVVTATRD